MELSVVTFNTQGAQAFWHSSFSRFDSSAKQLNLVDAQIIDLQEVFTYRHLRILKRHLTKFNYCVFERNIWGPKGGLVTFSKFPIEIRSYTPYSSITLLNTGQIGTYFRNLFTRKGILISKLRSSPIYFVNTHLTTNRDNDWSKNNRFFSIHQAQIKELCALINSIKHYSLIVISGDFNISKKSDLYKKLIKELHAKDVFIEHNSPSFHSEFMSNPETPNRIDYLLVKNHTKNFKTTGKKHLFTRRLIPKNINHGFLSDHIGLKADFEFQ